MGGHLPTRYYTQMRDEQIYRLMREGLQPKEVMTRLQLSTIDIVYKAIARRARSKEDRRKMPKIAE